MEIVASRRGRSDHCDVPMLIITSNEKDSGVTAKTGTVRLVHHSIEDGGHTVSI